jgi:hydroxypyruvate reductase
MPRPTPQLRTDALAIWQAGVEAVRSDRLVKDNVTVDGSWLSVGDETVNISKIGRIIVVGAGKAGAGMAAGLEETFGPQIISDKRVSGWVNVPADCVRQLHSIHLHAARPAGVNEPTEAGVLGAQNILEIVDSLGPDDICFCLISGGGSALLPAPIQGVSLAEKQAITRLLSAGGANIAELNTVRKQLSQIKGGRLTKRCRAGRFITLIISDVLGDPLDVIASGPTVPDSHRASDALAIMERYLGHDESVAPGAFRHLRRISSSEKPGSVGGGPACKVTNLVIGNNAVAVDAAGVEAERRGYSHAMHAATSLEGAAEDVGHDLATMTLRMMSEPGPDCLITGGEPTVKLAPPEIRGKGGRNQQLVLAALEKMMKDECGMMNARWALLSGGTDGEDGPTDAAGAVIDSEFLSRVAAAGLDPADFLRRSDAYSLFNPLGALIKTGPTHTNVCDVRVVVVNRACSD